MSTFNDGLYTPFTPAATLDSVIYITLPAVVATIVPSDTPVASVTPIATPQTSSTPVLETVTAQAPPTSTPSPTPTSLAAPTTTLAPVVSTSSTSLVVQTTPVMTSLSLFSPPTSLTTHPSTTSLPLLVSTGTRSSSSISSTSSPSPTSLSSIASSSEFKVSYLTPIFIIIPGLLLFTLIGWSYGKWWGKNRYDRNGRRGRWFPNGRSSFDGDRAILSPEEEGGLVQGRYIGAYNEKDGDGGGRYSTDEKGGRDQRIGDNGVASRWSSLLPAVITRHFRASVNNNNSSYINDPNNGGQGTSFISVPYSALDTPFDLPRNNAYNKSYLTPSADEHERRQAEERGWNWGTKPPSTTEYQGEMKENGRKSRNLAESWKWASKKYRAKRENSGSSFGGSERSRRTARELKHGHASPSLYSPSVENGDFEGGEAVLDLILAESRVGHGQFAQNYLSSDAQRNTFPIAPQPQQFRDGPVTTTSNFAVDFSSPQKRPSIQVELPTTPTTLRTSPQKHPNYLPGGVPSQLLFSYDSPPVQAFTSTSTQRDRAALERISGPPMHPSPTHVQTAYYRNIQNVGSAMPAFQPKVTASENNYSLNGVRGLVFGDEDELDNAVIRSVERRKEEEPTKVARAVEVLTTSQLRGPRLAPPSEYYSPPQEVVNVFNPTFTETAPLNRLAPSRVQSAIEELEFRTQTQTQSQVQTQIQPLASTSPTRRIPPSPQYPTKALPTSPAPSVTPLFSPKMEDAARIGTLLLQRSKTGTFEPSSPVQSSPGHPQDFFGPISPKSTAAQLPAVEPLTFGASSFARRPQPQSQTSSSTPERPLTTLEYSSIPMPPIPRDSGRNVDAPLSADPKRLSAMLRKNTGKTLRIVNPDEF